MAIISDVDGFADQVSLVTGTPGAAAVPVGAANPLPTSLTSTTVTNTVAVSGPLTDTQLRATAPAVNIEASLKSGTAARSVVASGIASVTILAANAARKGATIYNSDANALLLDLSGGTAAATRCQIRLLQFQNYEHRSGHTGAITGIWELDGTGQADVVEFS